MKGKEDVDGIPMDGKMMNLSLFELAYGKQVQKLANGASTRPFVSEADLQSDERSLLLYKRWKAPHVKQKLNVSMESGSWMRKVQRASIAKGEVRSISSFEHVDPLSEALPFSQRQHAVLCPLFVHAR